IRRADTTELVRRVREFLPEAEHGADLLAGLEAAGWDRFAAALPSLKERAKTLKDLVAGASYLTEARPLTLEEKAKRLLDGNARAQLASVRQRLAAAPRWEAAVLEAIARDYAEEARLKLGAVAQPLRAALTGRTVSPPLFDVMAVLGRE